MIKKSIGHEISEYINRVGLSDRKFAESIGMDPAQLNKYLTGKNEPTLKTIRRIQEKYPDFGNVDKNVNKVEPDKAVYEELISQQREIIGLLKERVEILEERHKTKEALQKMEGQISELQKSAYSQIENIETIIQNICEQMSDDRKAVEKIAKKLELIKV